MESDGDVWSKRLDTRSRYAICLGAQNTRSKFNVPLQIESQGFRVVPKRP